MKRWPYWVLGFWLLVVVCSLVWDFQPDAINLQQILAVPGQHAWLGADDLGRSIVARLAAGAGVSMLVALLVTAVTLSVGTAIGL